ncbi:phosphate-regulating neutral endopeptidase PHEX [Drosophila hydei]|uniref:Phosphate-regulating neutral endopeptidase PHEX n=1 Tax=Drosophila hydei TaxID=7224 RepID=A0A6J1LRU1_DROHY|nr:phosphate-regulating neutral endopeptidase PHEX [Drosophila hydei]
MRRVWFGALSAALLSLCLSCVAGHLLSLPELDTQIQLQEQLISQHNDSAYVQRVMRLAKSAEMRSYMQPQLDACEDFFAYSCGNWPKINPAHAAQPRETNYQQLLANGYRHKQQRLLEQPADEDSDDLAVLKLKQLYASCLRYRQTPLPLYRQQLQEIAAAFGRMPALALPGQLWPAEAFDWLATVAQIKGTYGLDILLLLQQAPELQNQTRRRLYVGQPPRSAVEAPHEVAAQLEQHLGLEASLARQTAQQIVELESLLAKGMSSRPLGVLTEQRSPAELANAYAPTFNLTHYVELVLQRPLQPDELLYEHVDSYQAHLLVVLAQTPPQALANYIFHKLLQHFYYDRSAPVVARCMDSATQLFPELLTNMAYRQYGAASTLDDIDAVWQQIKRSFYNLLEHSNSTEWLSLDTRRLVLDQVNATRLLVNGYAHLNFTERYKSLELKPHDFLFNLGAVLSQRSALEPPAVVPTGPAYDPLENQVLLPVALLQPNFLWSRFYPRALRYGSLGTIMAEQLAHSLDTRDAWDAATLAEFGKRKSCYRHQYERLRYAGNYLPSSELQDNNMADNAAIQLAYLGYRRYLANLATTALTTEQLPSLSHSPEQLFFISYAQLWCNDANEQFRDKQSLLLTGTPNALRVQGALANLADFARVFGCARESPMNPEQRCLLYGKSVN